ncbi:sigma-54 interaction domain-containing protein [Papillibacter cinnamivorans]|uniref:PAS domain S-box-containing protein n=1 Tax=Papillibacter cinnamivorans DSM 12816 TaxID=1122930 RepID=A0A1W2AT26_9FIRM|nr:sigma 54-interacting transcriptional regulator [Papillibacter cinnamivorans]SMC63853.1 PAS domain S-box-containing protein [Papillibacter cinnamivorans DSM 12816]
MKESRRHFSEISDILRCFDYVDEAVNILDRDGVFLYANKKVEDLYGLKREQIIGHDIVELVNRKDLKIFDVMESGKPMVDYEFSAVLRNGNKAYFLNNIYPVFDEANEVIGVCDIYRSYKRSISAVNKILGFHATYRFQDIIGDSPGIHRAVKRAKDYALTNKNILITGESGTGKELFAQAIHNYSKRCEGPFIAVNCASFPAELIESELFGYEEGAFTGARKGGNIGKFQLADGGTLFLDEIGEMPIHLQAKLLRAAESKTILRIGGRSEIPVDVRVISATNRDLLKMVRNNEFRTDLYYRLSTFSVEIPPLRSRTEDILALAVYFLNRTAAEDENGPKTFSAEAVQELRRYSWPGNVRELENVIYRIVINCKTPVIQSEDVVNNFGFARLESASAEQRTKPEKKVGPEELRGALAATGGNKKKAAELLGISRRTVYRILNQR